MRMIEERMRFLGELSFPAVHIAFASVLALLDEVRY